ncbi:uncharacterized protein DUF998 [Stackebrandtia endophytica]|uniref:Uncharacterized protein DUF998 n=1 Tax=Stackebrandtia endophytica TaxID=1496996 RepID=A0A543B0M8_9ACTN|nr:DUF998 domain-containing protein [Stackebrandtia endophytica]TQL78378.1 uncharacterized protein DUF998 [Stackebrandtia endophytica]
MTTPSPTTGRTPIPTRTLLIVATATGPTFYAVAVAQMLTREGFDIRVHPISQLATGGSGWIQVLNFVLTGIGLLGLAAAARRRLVDGRGHRAVPILLAIFGFGWMAAGFFPMDPQRGFPVGAPTGQVDMSWHGVVHSGAAALAFLALAVACVVGAVRALRLRRFGTMIGHAVVGLVLFIPVSPTGASIQIAVTGAVAFGWVAWFAHGLRRDDVDDH